MRCFLSYPSPERTTMDEEKQQNNANVEEEYMCLRDVAKYVNIKPGSLALFLKRFGIETHKFPCVRRKYVATSDVRRLKTMRERPWTIGQEGSS